jgi:hypothetical protein
LKSSIRIVQSALKNLKFEATSKTSGVNDIKGTDSVALIITTQRVLKKINTFVLYAAVKDHDKNCKGEKVRKTLFDVYTH